MAKWSDDCFSVNFLATGCHDIRCSSVSIYCHNYGLWADRWSNDRVMARLNKCVGVTPWSNSGKVVVGNEGCWNF